MGDSKLSALTATTTITDSDEYYINDGGTSKKVLHGVFKANLSTATITTLAGLTTGTNYAVNVLGRASNGDGGEGAFVWNATDLSTEVTADTQKGIYVPPTSDTSGASGAWVRQCEDEYHVEWFGAVADGSTAATNNTAMIQACIDMAHQKFAGGGTKVVRFGGGQYNVATEVTVPYGITIQGTGQYWDGGTIVKGTDVAEDVFVLTDNAGGFQGVQRIYDIYIEAGKRGIYANPGGGFTLRNITLKECVIGVEIIRSNSNVLENVFCDTCGTGLRLDYVSTRYSDQTSFIDCRFNKSTGNDLEIVRSAGLSFQACQFVGNEGSAIVIDNEVNETDANFLFWREGVFNTGAVVFIAPYFEEDSTNTSSDPLVDILNAANVHIVGGKFLSYSTKTNGAIYLRRSHNIIIEGDDTVFNIDPLANFAVIDRTCFEVTIKTSGKAWGNIVDNGINSHIFRENSLYIDEETAPLSNIYFGTTGGGGADVFANWSEAGDTDMSQETSNLHYPSTISTGALKVTKAATAVDSTIAQLSTALTGSKKYYLNITYRNNTPIANNEAPIQLYIQNGTDSYKNYNWSTGAWDNSNTGGLKLPIMANVYTLSIPFTAPPSSSQIYVYLSFPDYGSNKSDAAEYTVYRLSIDTVPYSPELVLT